MRTFALAATLLGLSASPSLAATYAPGDTLECPAKAGGETVQIVVGKLDAAGSKAVVSVSMFNDRPGTAIPEAGHLPFDAEALKGCTAAAKRALSGNFSEGYAMWREAFDKGKGGYFTITPSEAYGILLQQVPQ